MMRLLSLSAALLLQAAAMPFAAQAAQDRVVYAFPSDKVGDAPPAGLTYLGGRLYGVTSGGSPLHGGTVFSVSKKGGHRYVHEFAGGSDGTAPWVTLLNVDGVLYGTTSGGGAACNCGTVFSISADGSYKQLYQFEGGSDGAQPQYDLAAIGGVIYGTTSAGGGPCNCGTVFSVTPQGAESVVYRFQGGRDGAGPAGVITDGSLLYGVTSAGGAGEKICGQGCGTAYSLTTTGLETQLHVFGNLAKGIVPAGRLLLEGSELYGTTTLGGSSTACGTDGCGTVFRLSLAGGFKTLHDFALSDGNRPQAGLTDVHGVFYGTTLGGGAKNWGVVFGMSRNGAVSVVHSFGARGDGSEPFGDLNEVAGTLYGTTYGGGVTGKKCGRYGCGVVFAVTP